MANNYWMNRPFSRRSALRSAGLGSMGIAGAALIGCGEDEPAPQSSGSTGAPGAPSGTTAPGAGGASDQPQSGGILRTHEVGDTEDFDVLSCDAATGAVRAGYAYSRLLKNTIGDGTLANGDWEGDLAESYEQADELTYIFHLREGVTWDQREPTSGREFVAEDVQRSWEKTEAVHKYRADMAHSVNEAASIVSLTAVDDYTVEMKLAFPDSLAIGNLNQGRSAGFWIMPMESMDGGFDPTREMRGTGPFIQTEYRPAVGFKYERNPNWHHGPDRPYIDGVEIAIIPESAQVEAQFRAGNIHTGGEEVGVGNPGNIPIVASEVPGTAIRQTAPEGTGTSLCFNWMPDSPFKDIRVRRAMSMALDRDTFIDVNYDPGAYEALGISLNYYWNTPTTAAYGEAPNGFWLNPKGDLFGPAAQNLHHNIEEARALLDAAGFNDSNPLEYDIIFPGNRHDQNRTGQAETWQAMSAEAGINVHVRSVDYASDWLNVYTDARGYFDFRDGRTGVLYKPNGARPDPGIWYANFFAAAGSISIVGDEFPELEALVQEHRAISDFQERVEQSWEIQRYAIENMVCCPVGAQTDHTDIYWEGLRGADRYHQWPGGLGTAARGTEVVPLFWMDETLRA